FSSRSRYTSFSRDWSSDVCSSDLAYGSHRALGSLLYPGQAAILDIPHHTRRLLHSLLLRAGLLHKTAAGDEHAAPLRVLPPPNHLRLIVQTPVFVLK